MKYTAEEVQAIAKRLHDDITVADGDALVASDMLTDYAERIKADEVAADYPECSGDPSSCPENEGHGCCKPNPPAQAAHGEASLGRCKACGRATGSVCDGLDGNGLGCTNVPSIDLAAVREVIESHINEAKKLRHDPESQDYLYEQADKLEAAIKGVAP